MKDISEVFFKQYNQIIKEARADSKLEYCLCCNKKVSSFCNSHSLPKFILSNLSEMGMILNSNHFFEAPFIKEAKGVKNSGTFIEFVMNVIIICLKIMKMKINY